MSNMQSPLSRARGLGSAGHGAHHWWLQRLTSVALVPLVGWFVYFILRISTLDYDMAYDWLGEPFTAVAMILFVMLSSWHMLLGLQVVIEDYIHCNALKIAILIAVKFIFFTLAASAIFAVLKIAFTG